MCRYISDHLSVFNVEDLAAEHGFQPVLLAAGDENLAAGDAVEDKFLPAGVQLGEHIVEQEDGRKARQLAENVALGEFEGERRGAGLTLRGKGAGGGAPMETSISSLCGPERHRREASSAW